MSKPYHEQILNESSPVTAVEGRKIPDRLKYKNSQTQLQEILAILRAQAWMYQTLHWQTKGSNFYGNHLLYERLYNSVNEEIDILAEKLVGYFGEISVDSQDSMEKTSKWLKEWSNDPLDSEKSLQQFLSTSYEIMKTKKELTLGLDDFIMGLANSHETNLYLLGQNTQK